MFRKLIERLETLVEPQIDASQYVSHYTPSLIYKKTETPVKYVFNIEEHTQLNRHSVKNGYTQELAVQLSYKANEGCKFDIITSKYKFVLDNSLAQQTKLLEDLSTLTEHLNIIVSGKGIIKSVDHKNIIKKWEQLKPTLLERYQSNQAHAYIEGVGEKVENENLLLQDIKQVRLLGLLFGGYQSAHEKDAPRECKISNLIHCLPVSFKEQIKEIKEDKRKQEKQIYTMGRMLPIAKETKDRIQKYFSYYKTGNPSVYLSNYKRKVILDLQTGFPKTVRLDVELTNGKGYLRQQHYNLTQISNG